MKTKDVKEVTRNEFYNRVMNNDNSEPISINDIKGKSFFYNMYDDTNTIWMFEDKPFVAKNKWEAFKHIFSDDFDIITELTKEDFDNIFKPLLEE